MKKQGQLNNTFLCFLLLLYRYIPLQKYTVPKNEKLRYRLGLAGRPQFPPEHRGQRSGDDTSVLLPVQPVRARTGRGLCVVCLVCVIVCLSLLFDLQTQAVSCSPRWGKCVLL